MKVLSYRLSLIILSVFLALPMISAQYRISISAPDFPHDTLLFGHYFSSSLILKDTFYLNQDGKGSISGNESLPVGMYTVYFPSRVRLDVIIDKDQEFSFSTDSSNLLGSTEFKGTTENKLFYEYLNYLENQRNSTKDIQERIQNPVNTNDSIAAREEINLINEKVKKYVEGVIEEGDGSFLSVFLLSLKEVEVPDAPLDEKGEPVDKNFQVKYFKQHYFDHFDLSDVRLMRTPVYERKLLDYLSRWIYPVPDSIYREVDMLIEKSRTDSLLFKYMLTTVFNYYAKSEYVGMDAVYAYIAEKYYIPEAHWSDPEFIEKLKERVKKIDPLIIGKKGPDIQLVKVPDEHFILAESDTAAKRNPYVGNFINLYQIPAKFTVLYFWEADCGHCGKTIPLLYDLYNRKKDKGLQVVAISLLGGVEGKEKWIDFINEHKLYGWINAWNPYDFSYKDAYDVASSNILYLLDEDKVILAKKIGPEQVEEILNYELEEKDKEKE